MKNILLIISLLIIIGCVGVEKSKRDYVNQRNKHKEMFSNYSEGLSIRISPTDTIFSVIGDTVFLLITFKNTSELPYLLKRPYSFGDDMRSGDIRIYVDPPENVHLTKWGFEPVSAIKLPTVSQFIELRPGDSITMNRNVNFFIEKVLTVTDSSYGTVIYPGEYSVYISYENYDFLSALGDSVYKKIWMGRLESNSIRFRVKE